jgi:hypothetical protein
VGGGAHAAAVVLSAMSGAIVCWPASFALG